MKRIATKNDVLKVMIDNGVVKFLPEPVRLKSGRYSRFYVSGRGETTLNTELGVTIGHGIRSHIKDIVQSEHDKRKICYIGIPTVGTGLAAATTMTHLLFGEEDLACYAILREELKTRGPNQSWVNGKPDHAGMQYFLIDNVVTTGESFIEGAKKLHQDEFNTKEVHGITLVDRSMDDDAMQKTCVQAGLKSITAIFALANIVEKAVYEKWWPEEALDCFIKEKANWHRSGGGESY